MIAETQEDSNEGIQKQKSAGPYYYPSLFGLFEPLQLLLENEEDEVNRIGGYYHTALQAACAKSHMQIVLLLTKNDVNLDVQGGNFGSAINAAAALGHEEILIHLIKLEANLSLKDGNGKTSLV